MTRLKKDKLITTLFFLVAFIIAFVVLFYFYMQPLNQNEIVKLYQQNAKVEADFFAISEMENIVLVPKNGEFEITFKGNGCSLVTTYDKDFNLLTQKIKDTRMLNSIWVVLLLSAALSLMAPCVLFVLVIIGFGIYSLVGFTLSKIRTKRKGKVH